MKNFATTMIITLLVISFMSISVFAQELNFGITNEEVDAPSLQSDGIDDLDERDTDASQGETLIPRQQLTDEQPNGVVNTELTNQEVDSGITNPVVNKPISDKEQDGGAVVTEYDVYIGEEAESEVYSTVEFNTEAIFREKEVLDPTKIYIKTDKKVTPEIQSAIFDLRVNPAEIFSPVFSAIENLVVEPVLEDEKVVYKLETKEVNKPIFKGDEVIQPIFDLRVDYPVEFKLVDNRIIVNDEQIIDYKNIVREKEVIPPIQIALQSAITDDKIYDLKVIPSPESTEFKFLYREKEVMMSIYSDFKVEDKKLSLIHNNKPYDLRVNPPEIYSAVYDLTVKEPKIVVKEFSLGIENEKAVYDLRVEQPAKILWIIPWTVESKYVIDPTDGRMELANSPWWITSENLGSNMGFKLNIPSDIF